MPFEFESVDQTHVRRHEIEELRQLPDVVLAVAIGIEDKILPRGGETASQRLAVSEIGRMRYHPEGLPMTLLQAGQHAGGLVPAAVVDNDDFEIRYAVAKYVECLVHQLGDRRRVIVGGKKKR